MATSDEIAGIWRELSTNIRSLKDQQIQQINNSTLHLTNINNSLTSINNSLTNITNNIKAHNDLMTSHNDLMTSHNDLMTSQNDLIKNCFFEYDGEKIENSLLKQMKSIEVTIHTITTILVEFFKKMFGKKIVKKPDKHSDVKPS